MHRAAALAVRGAAAAAARPPPASDSESDEPHLLLLLGREGVDHAVDGLGRAVGVQRAEHEQAHLGRRDRERDRLAVAHLADQHHVGVLADRGAQRRPEAAACACPTSRCESTELLVLVHELDRILDRDDVACA